ncbi:MAG: cell division protein FtsL [Actinomycetota bacterium]|nr:cell division protein FtsL [Actinomycetota bacterium]
MSIAARAHGPKHAPRIPFALLVVGLIVGGMCALLALNTASAANELSRHNLATRDAGIAAQVQQLRNDVAASAAPGSLGSAAAALGMVPAGNPAFLQVGPNGVVRVLGSPAPATAVPQPAPVKATPLTTPVKPPAASLAQGHAARPTSTGTKTMPKTRPPTPSPTTTPTPTTTLPGGAR